MKTSLLLPLLALLLAPFAFAEKTGTITLSSSRQCSEISSSTVYNECIEAFKTTDSFEYPAKLQLYVSRPHEKSAQQKIQDSVAASTPPPVDNRTPTEKHLQTIAVATTVTAVVSVASAVFSLILLFNL